MTLTRTVITASAWALVYVFPVSALVALCYRFPFPMGGDMGGIEAAKLSFLAVIMYGMLGGFIWVALVGAAGGFMVFPFLTANAKKNRWLIHLAAIGSVAVFVFLFVMSDKIFGP